MALLQEISRRSAARESRRLLWDRAILAHRLHLRSRHRPSSSPRPRRCAAGRLGRCGGCAGAALSFIVED
ncbi:hypothetical protein Mapa_006402 [Marchantia paleacea]|nr:hypothetical protein Mapa_006402 [Marchantia paleacea]